MPGQLPLVCLLITFMLIFVLSSPFSCATNPTVYSAFLSAKTDRTQLFHFQLHYRKTHGHLKFEHIQIITDGISNSMESSRHGIHIAMAAASKLPRPRQAHIQHRLPGSFIPCGLHLDQCAFRFLLLAEYILHSTLDFFIIKNKLLQTSNLRHGHIVN